MRSDYPGVAAGWRTSKIFLESLCGLLLRAVALELTEPPRNANCVELRGAQYESYTLLGNWLGLAFRGLRALLV